MQEELNDKIVALSVQATKFTARELKQLLVKFLTHESSDKGKTVTESEVKHGKMKLKELNKDGAGLSNIEISDKTIGSFQKYANKYNVDFSLMKDKSVDPPKYIVFFKSKDADQMNQAFKEYTKKELKKSEKKSIKEELKKNKELVKVQKKKVRHKKREVSL